MDNITSLPAKKLLCAYTNQLLLANDNSKWVALIRGRLESFKLMLNVLAITKSINPLHVTSIIEECKQFTVIANKAEYKELLHPYLEDARLIVLTLEKYE